MSADGSSSAGSSTTDSTSGASLSTSASSSGSGESSAGADSSEAGSSNPTEGSSGTQDGSSGSGSSGGDTGSGGSFPCGALVECLVDSQYCEETVGGKKGARPQYVCQPLPDGCAPDASCACLAEVQCGDQCAALPDGGLQVTCFAP